MRRQRGFTLIEVLVVVGIIALLIAILLPSLAAARRAAKSTVCLSQAKQIGTATSLYAQASSEFLPRSSHTALAAGCKPWGYALLPHLGFGRYRGPGPSWDRVFNGLYRCPEDPRKDRWSFGKSVWFEMEAAETGEFFGVAAGPVFHKTTAVPRPGTTVHYGELESKSKGVDHIMAQMWHMGGTPEVAARRHGSTCNHMFVDGHAEARMFKSTFDAHKQTDFWNPAKKRITLLASN